MNVDEANSSETQALAALALQACSGGVLVFDAILPAYPVVIVNQALCQISGYADPELRGAHCALLANAALREALASVAAGGAEARVQLTGRDGANFALRVAPLRGAGGALTHLIGLADAPAASSAQAHAAAPPATPGPPGPPAAHDPAQLDELTGLPNRAAFRTRLDQSLAGSGAGLAVLSIGFDMLGPILEQLGHHGADQLLAAIAQRLQRCLGSADTLARRGCHDFVLLREDVASASQVGAISSQLLAALTAPFMVGGQLHVSEALRFSIGGQELQLQPRIGSARYPHDSLEAQALLNRADMALAQARAGGAERWASYDIEMSDRALALTRMQVALQLAVSNDELRLSYQPIADLQLGSLCGLAAVLRWHHPELGMLDAARFMPAADDAALSGAIGEWSLRRALADICNWQGAGLPVPPVALKISPRQFRDHALPARLTSALDDFGVAPELLALEVSEAALMYDPGASADTLDLLKALGVGLTLDDFGADHASLSHLKRFPLELVRIGAALTAQLLPEGHHAALAKTIIDCGHEAGLKVVAAGVDSEEQCDFLRRNMCDQVQGLLPGAEQDAAGVPALLRARQLLAPHLLRIQQRSRTLLLVDDEQNIVSALKRLVRPDGYKVLTAGSGREGLEVLAAHGVDVIVSDQRMPGMLGADFLRAAKDLYPDTIRIMLSGYTELQSVTDAVNEGAIYKFLTKPWDDDSLRGHIAEAFRMKETSDENERLNLALRTANHEMALTNRRMEELLRQNQQQITRGEISLNIARELLECMPLPVIGLDEEGMVAFVNSAAEAVFNNVAILGSEAQYALPELFASDTLGSGSSHEAQLGGQRYKVAIHPMGLRSASRGSLITLSHCIDTP